MAQDPNWEETTWAEISKLLAGQTGSGTYGC